MTYLPLNQQQTTKELQQTTQELQSRNWLSPLRQQLNQLEIPNEFMAHVICQIVPVQCPFERDIYLFGRKVAHIPPLCKINPFYEEVMGLRFRALCYLADECGKDVRCYC